MSQKPRRFRGQGQTRHTQQSVAGREGGWQKVERQRAGRGRRHLTDPPSPLGLQEDGQVGVPECEGGPGPPPVHICASGSRPGVRWTGADPSAWAQSHASHPVVLTLRQAQGWPGSPLTRLRGLDHQEPGFLWGRGAREFAVLTGSLGRPAG